MSRYKKETLRLQPNNTWSAKKGYKICVLDRGAVRFNFPAKWVAIPDEDSFKIYDRKPPNDDCVLAVSYMRLPPYDFSGLPIAKLVEVANEGDERPIYDWGPIVEDRRGPMELAWREMRFVDPKEQREAFSRLCLARQGPIQALITFEFWESDAARYRPVWDTVLETLRLNDYIADPTRGPWGRDQ